MKSDASPSWTLGLMVIATGTYLEFAQDLAEDADGLLGEGRVALNLFTDRPDEAEARLGRLTRLALNVIPIPSLRWPEATLLRYEIFHRHQDRIIGDALVYLDADLRLKRPLDDALARLEQDPVLAVRHPGYYNRGRRGPRGTWETRRRSAAFIPRLKRRMYVCGGVWMGQREGVLALSAELSGRVARDSKRGVTAVWHDESHWNWYVAEYDIPALSPAYCFVPSYPWLSGIKPVIVAVEKGAEFKRETTNSATHARWRAQ